MFENDPYESYIAIPGILFSEDFFASIFMITSLQSFASFLARIRITFLTTMCCSKKTIKKGGEGGGGERGRGKEREGERERERGGGERG